MKKRAFGIVAASAFAIAALAIPAAAAQPANPGCFGEIRSANIDSYYRSGGQYDVAPGGSEWGDLASDRAGTNGESNQAFKIFCGGNPA